MKCRTCGCAYDALHERTHFPHLMQQEKARKQVNYPKRTAPKPVDQLMQEVLEESDSE